MTSREKMDAFRKRMTDRQLREVKVWVPEEKEYVERIQQSAADLRIETGRILPGDQADTGSVSTSPPDPTETE